MTESLQEIGPDTQDAKKDWWVPPNEISLAGLTVEAGYESPELPVRFYRDSKERSIVVLLDDVATSRPERSGLEPEVQPDVTEWAEFERQTMFDSTSMHVLTEVTRLRNRGNSNVVLIGDMATAKSFFSWGESCLLGLPFYGTTFGTNTETDQILGMTTLKPDYLLSPIPEILENPYIMQAVNDNPKLKPLVEKLREEYGKDPKVVPTLSLRLLASSLGWQPDIFIKQGEIGFEDSFLMKAIQRGYLVCIDEKNRTAYQNALTDVLNADKTTIAIPERGAPILKHPRTFIIATENPPRVAGTEPTPEHIESRENAITLEKKDVQFYMNLYEFFIHGNNPEFIYEGRKYRHKQDLPTEFRGQLEQIDGKILLQLIPSLAKLHMTLISMVEQKRIGKSRKDPGNYVFDQRDVREILKSIRTALRGFSAKPNGQGGVEQQADWEQIIKTALYQQYKNPVNEGDKKVVQDLIDNMPIWDMFNTKGQPDWKGNSANIKAKPSGAGNWKIRDLALDGESAIAVPVDKLRTMISADSHQRLLVEGLIATKELTLENAVGIEGQVSEDTVLVRPEGYFGSLFCEAYLREKRGKGSKIRRALDRLYDKQQ
jgi:hypothetical protein